MTATLDAWIKTHADAGIPFGPDGLSVVMPESFGSYEAEYAALRRRVGVVPMPQRGVLCLRGADVKDFLQNLLSADLNAIQGGASVPAYLLDERGHILGDLTVHHGDASTWLEADRCDLPGLREYFDARLFTEDVTLEDWSGAEHPEARAAFEVHGPKTQPLLEAIETPKPESSTVAAAMSMLGTHHVVMLDDKPVTLSRRDTLGVPGAVVWAKASEITRVLDRVLEAGGYDAQREAVPDGEESGAETERRAGYADERRQSLRARPVGWSAYNTGRVEAGSPLYHVDFGPDGTPNELPDLVMEAALSLTKGCYTGQEAVARVKNLSHPKRKLVGLKLPEGALPMAGTALHQLDGKSEGNDNAGEAMGDSHSISLQGKTVGVVTSSALSPMAGQAGLALATVKWGAQEPGTQLAVATEQGPVLAGVVALPFA